VLPDLLGTGNVGDRKCWGQKMLGTGNAVMAAWLSAGSKHNAGALPTAELTLQQELVCNISSSTHQAYAFLSFSTYRVVAELQTEMHMNA